MSIKKLSIRQIKTVKGGNKFTTVGCTASGVVNGKEVCNPNGTPK